MFVDIDNPREWDSFMFRPKFQGKYTTVQCSHHDMPAGTCVLQKDPKIGKRMTPGRWKIHHTPWKDTNKNTAYYRVGTNKDSFYHTTSQSWTRLI